MLRLTICSGRNGKFLARIVDQDGYPFVLDFGDRRVIDDVAQRLARGFTRMKFEKLLNVQPSDQDMLLQLADYYASKGYLIVLDEPNWGGRDHAVLRDPHLEQFHAPSSSEVSALEEEEDSLADFSFDHLPDFTEDLPTEFASEWSTRVEDGETEFIVRDEPLETEETDIAFDGETEIL